MNSETFVDNVLSQTIDRIVNGRNSLPPEEQNRLAADVPFSKANFFSFCAPGIPVEASDFSFLKGLRPPIDYEKWKDLPAADKEAMSGDASYPLTVAMDNFSLLVDTVPNKEGMVNSLQVWEPQNRISYIYEGVLKSCEVADTVPSADAEERIKKIKAQLTETVQRTDIDDPTKTFTEERPSQLVMMYNKYAEAYLSAYSKYVDLMIGAISGSAADVQRASILGPQSYISVTAAYDLWESQGQKTRYEKLNADLAQLEGISMSVLRREYLDMFTRSKRASLIDLMDYNVARLVPGGFYESDGWSEYSFSSSELATTDTSKTKKFSGSARYGLFGGGRGSYKQLDTSNTINFDGASMSFELAQVPIVRSWFREEFLTSSKWRPKAQADAPTTLNANDILSNGNIENPQGKLFAYPTVALFARNIRVTKSLYEQLSNASEQSANGSGAFNLGPFSLGAKASYNQSEKHFQVSQQQGEMVVAGMQILGFRNHILPPSPNPDPNIQKWI